jgi:hypothetical protein
MGLLDTICHISTDVEQITPSMYGTSTYSLIVHSFTIHNINRESLSFDELIVDPYDKLLFAVQNFIMDGFESDYPDLAFENYVTPTPEVTPTSTVEPTED